MPPAVKTLISLIHSDPSNRSCADCQSALVDPSSVYASLCPRLEVVVVEQRGDKRKGITTKVALHDFCHTHRAFAPPDVQAQQEIDPAVVVNQRFGGHGLFVCTKCAEAHKALSENITKVIPVQDSKAWTEEDAEFMKISGGNAKSKNVYEAYMPESWQKLRPIATSSLQERVVFCKAKYEALAFTMPPPGPLAKTAWRSILQKSETGIRFNSRGLQDIYRLVPSHRKKLVDQESRISGGVLPNRMIDFFCVVSTAGKLHPRDMEKDFSQLKRPEDLHLLAEVMDCYPPQDVHSDMIFPDHLPTFCLPNGCCPRRDQQPPSFYTFVLTLGDGDRIYGGALQVHDEHMDTEKLQEVIVESGYTGELPQFLIGESDIVFLPKCLILLSHYPFFDLFRESLLQIYRTTLLEAPLPIERYIANLVSEVPLPPQGKVRVEFGFTSSKVLGIERPPINALPMANFSFRPLFALLSVANVMVVLGCLMEECKVALLSKHCSILTPVAEAFFSALFPFEWQGLYIPTMPFSMLDVLDAPVPFLVGLDSQYLREVAPEYRPKNVVFVDLDRDVIHLGVDDLTDENRKVPALPSRDALKLKSSLDLAGGSMYLLPSSGIKGCIMEGHTQLLLVANEARPKYAQMESVTIDEESMGRTEVLERAVKAYDENELAESGARFRTEHGQMKESDGNDNDSSADEQRQTRNRLTPNFMRNKREEMLANSKTARKQAHLLDMTDPHGFSPSAIRNAFLRFMVAVFMNYPKFIIEKKRGNTFDEQRFLRDLNEDPEARDFIGRVLKTQMFQRFLEERMDNPESPEIRFFDESILAKLNRSKVTKMAKGGKLPTPFLDDESGKITKTYTPPPPSNLGLPPEKESYHYIVFPRLDQALFGRVRHPVIWDNMHQQSTRWRSKKNVKARKAQLDILKRAMVPIVSPASMAASAARKSVKDLDAALSALKRLHWEKMVSPRASRTRSPKPTRTSTQKVTRNLSQGSVQQSLSSISTESTESERTIKTLSQADTILIDARRKQSILLDLLIKIQAHCRMYLVRTRYLKQRNIIDRRANAQELIARTLTSLQGVMRIQRFGRRLAAKRKLQRIMRSIVLVQRKARGHVARQRFARVRASAVQVQKHARGRIAWRAFLTIRLLVCRVQAHAKGFLLRRSIKIVVDSKLKLYRTTLVSLWQASGNPLSARTKLWSSISGQSSLAKVRVAENELTRNWKLLHVSLGGKGEKFSDEITAFAGRIGIDIRYYCLCKELSIADDSVTVSVSERSTLPTTSDYVEAERLQIHERLDSKACEEQALSLYEKFGIPAGEKMKKVALAKAIWSKPELADSSHATMMVLFPELDGSLNISFQQPSKKSKRRFPLAPKTPISPLTREIWEGMSLEDLIRQHSKEVTHIFLTKVPALMAKLNKAGQKNKQPVVDDKECKFLRRYLEVSNADNMMTTGRNCGFFRNGESLHYRDRLREEFTNVRKGESADFPDIIIGEQPNSTNGDANLANFPDIGLENKAPPTLGPGNEQEKGEEVDSTPTANFPEIL